LWATSLIHSLGNLRNGAQSDIVVIVAFTASDDCRCWLLRLQRQQGWRLQRWRGRRLYLRPKQILPAAEVELKRSLAKVQPACRERADTHTRKQATKAIRTATETAAEDSHDAR
jgi:hypothetical protein